jgi:hypothetical protein
MYSVLLYKNTPNLENVPGDWPAEVSLLPEGVTTVEAPYQPMTEEEYQAWISNPELIAAKNLWNLRQSGVSSPVAYIVIPKVSCSLDSTDPLYQIFKYQIRDGEPDRIYCVENMPLQIEVEMRNYPTQEVVLPVTDSFSMPMTGENKSTQLLLISIVDGKALINLRIPETGVYEITEELINRELPENSKFGFKGIRLYVLRTTF